ncbi:alpha/beta hydrolase family esterase [Ramlibacter algicola]|uniref:PHB depolymerase family esterase n=1 Tax=Ramlibacter algicola TaxID=2795217 RepID=A0A934Q2E7_9BURK|nr:PHB depolymerase family esterase [Ramlibacter algicola]MBK0393810.1 PHB depolymerase family esterase [Ramlibacter algicola]
MPPNLHHLIREATRLTRVGDLTGATRAIQQALGNGATPANDVIDVEAREVRDLALPGRDAVDSRLRGNDERGGNDGEGANDATARPPTPEAFIAGRFGGPDLLGRDYKLYIPPDAAHQPRPLVLMLHGCTQDPDDFARGTRMNELAREEGAFVLYPAQAQRANAQRCWNWFKHSHQARGRGEVQLLADMVRDVIASHAIDASRVYVAGLSAGGAMAANLVAAFPELFAAVGVHSGLPAGAAQDLQSGLAAMKQGPRNAGTVLAVPAIVFHGDADNVVHPANGDAVIKAASGSDALVATETGTTKGRRFTRRLHADRDGGRVRAEHWVVHGAGHAWSGGSARGSYADAIGPDASAEMLRFFREHARG